MPRRDDIQKILIIGSGPIVIGQACEFDYSGVQACKALREEGYEVTLVNSNPATIMTDPEMADRTYIEPITWQYVQKIIETERPDALLPTLGGQTGLNVAMDLARRGVLDQLGVELIGAKEHVIAKAEERASFKKAMESIGLDVPISFIVHNLDEGRQAVREIGLPIVIRPSYTLGGSGGGIAYNKDEFEAKVRRGLELSPVHEVLLEQSVIGWKEYEMEVMRDQDDNVVIICSIENFDPCGIHTGDSITVAPAQTLTDKEYQRLRDASLAVIREIGVETGAGLPRHIALHALLLHGEPGFLVVVEIDRAADGMRLAINVAAVLIAFLGLIAMIDFLLGLIDQGLSLAGIFATLFAPVAVLLGVTISDVPAIADLLGIKLVTNEFVAYVKLSSEYQGVINDRSHILATFALTGFANFGSVGILLGGIGGMAPSRRADLARLSSRALLAGFVATLINAAIAAIVI